LPEIPANCVLRYERVTKAYRSGLRRRVPAVRDVSLAVGPGEIVALLGRNGAGKTTLMKLGLGLLRPTAGRGELLGRPLGDRESLRRVGYQPEQPYLYPFLTVGETLRFFGELSGLRGRCLAGRVAAVMEECGLGEMAPRPVRRLSRGWQQRVTLAAALLPDPQLLMLDEPLGGLDPEVRIGLKALMRRWRDAGRTILINSHILPDVETLADRVVLLQSGRVVAEGPLDALLGGEIEGFEIELRGCPAALAGGELLWRRADPARSLWWLPGRTAPEMQGVLRGLIADGFGIVAVRPRRENLEAFFSRAMRAGTPEGVATDWRAAG
jgi:ABC-2 type transport system ATP-binding protein